jgi:hypothetical protein
VEERRKEETHAHACSLTLPRRVGLIGLCRGVAWHGVAKGAGVGHMCEWSAEF